tara:strand:+ start:3083 stop:5659 length:2577 start_codon:yes stop_codon:yes gene_type:complete
MIFLKYKFLYLIFFIFLIFIFIINKHSFDFGDGPTDIMIFVDQLYLYIFNDSDMSFRSFIKLNYNDLLSSTLLESNNPGISPIETTVFFDRDQYRLLIFFPLIILKFLLFNIDTGIIMMINNTIFSFVTIIIIFEFGKKIISSNFGYILVILNLFNIYYMQLFWSAAENYIFYYIPLFYLSLFISILFLEKIKLRKKIINLDIKLILTTVLIFLNGYPNSFISIIFFVLLFTLIFDRKNFFYHLFQYFQNFFLGFILFSLISISYSLFLNEQFFFQIQSILFRFYQIYDFFLGDEVAVNSLNIDFNIFNNLKNSFLLLTSNNLFYHSPHESGYLLSYSFFNILEIICFILSLLFIKKLKSEHHLAYNIFITIFIFFIIRSSFDLNLLIGKSNYDFYAPLIFIISISIFFFFKNFNLFNNKFFSSLKILYLKIYVFLKYFSLINLKNININSSFILIYRIFLLLLLPSIVFFNCYNFKNTFVDKHYSSIGPFNGLNDVYKYISNHKELSYIFNFNDYFLYSAPRILFNTGKLKYRYDNEITNYPINNNFAYITPKEITNYPLFNRFSGAGYLSAFSKFYAMPDIIFKKNKKPLYKLYFHDVNINSYNLSNVNFINEPDFKQILINDNFNKIEFSCSSGEIIPYLNLSNYFDYTLFDFSSNTVSSTSSPFTDKFINLTNTKLSSKSSINGYSNNEFILKNPGANSKIELNYSFNKNIDNVEIYFPIYFLSDLDGKNKLEIFSDNFFNNDEMIDIKSFKDNKYGNFRFTDGNNSNVTFIHSSKNNVKNMNITIKYHVSDHKGLILPYLDKVSPKTLPFAKINISKKEDNFFKKIKNCNIVSFKLNKQKHNDQDFYLLKTDD